MNNPETTDLFYYNEQGLFVFTEKFHLQRGYCCGNGCIHCPYPLKTTVENEHPINNEIEKKP